MLWRETDPGAGTMSAAGRMRALLDGIPAPLDLHPIALHLGESALVAPQHGYQIDANAERWAHYPRPGGPPELRVAYLGWLSRRFGVSAQGLSVEPTPGSKQAMSVAIMRAVGRAPGRPVILPNPLYPAYTHSSRMAGADQVFYRPAHGGDAIAAAVRECGRAAAVVVCSPGNPAGEVLNLKELAEIASAAAEADAVLIADECYTDLVPGGGAASLLQLGPALAGQKYLVAHTLSKRSAMPGLRSGFVAGDPETVGDYATFNRLCGVSSSDPVNEFAARLWSDDAHVEQGRTVLQRNWEMADHLLGHLPGYRRARAGMFLWLPVSDDEALTRALWTHQALTVMPGRYLAYTEPDGTNPGAGYVRIGLVHRHGVMLDALKRLAFVFDHDPNRIPTCP